MDQQLFQLESLPNELILNLFKYLNTLELFRAFYNLNFRFNSLIQSLNHLSLTISKYDEINKDYLIIIYPYINTLFIDPGIYIDLSCFTKIRRLILMVPSPGLLTQLNTCILPLLEHLSITYILGLNSISTLYIKIFSNGFSKLKSCYLLGMNTIQTIQEWRQSPSLKILKIGQINLFIYKAILSSCPNLYFLQMNISTLDTNDTNIEPHMNLKRLKIRVGDCIWSWENFNINKYLLYVPNLEQFSVRVSAFVSKIEKSILEYDWFASIIRIYLPLLYRFYFYFHVLDMKIPINDQIFHRIEKDFKNVHHNRYQSRFIIVRFNSIK